MDEESAKRLVASVPHWHHKFEIFQGIWTNGSYDPRFMLDLIGLPQNLTGKTVLDIGMSDGFFARQLFLRSHSRAIIKAQHLPETQPTFGFPIGNVCDTCFATWVSR
jgi:tRNA (mo5U34)-methyltransferase